MEILSNMALVWGGLTFLSILALVVIYRRAPYGKKEWDE